MSSQQSKTSTAVSPRYYKRVLVGCDGSDNSLRALERAAAIAKESGGSLKVLVVVNPNVLSMAPISPQIPEEVFDDLANSGKQVLADAMVAAGKLVPKVTGIVEEGNPAERILTIAADDDADLIVLGRRGISGVRRFLMGGVSSRVVSHSKCDVLIVR